MKLKLIGSNIHMSINYSHLHSDVFHHVNNCFPKYLWWVDLGQQPASHTAALSLSLLYRTEGRTHNEKTRGAAPEHAQLITEQ